MNNTCSEFEVETRDLKLF